MYNTLESCLIDLEKNGELIRVKEEIDPFLEMAAVHLRVHEKKGPALLFENIKGCNYRAASNIFGTLVRSKFIFRNSFEKVQKLIQLKNDPLKAFRKPLKNISVGLTALKALPLKKKFPAHLFSEIKISDLPLIHHWPMDGGAFVTLPQVFTEDIDKPGIMNANTGMYRIQLNGNDYILNQEIGLHYQLHRGIGVHQTKANLKGQPLKVSIFVGGPPAHSVAAVMPLPEGISESVFAGVLGNRRFRYSIHNGYYISLDADFVITGEVFPLTNKPEGPFGDHLGYYSLKHDFPVMKVDKVFAKKNGIWPFTVVGRPPQEDTSFGELIHELTGEALANEIPGVKEVYAVDAAGVHPLLLAIGSERYTPYQNTAAPSELLTIANHILGTGQLSLAKFLFITASEKSSEISTYAVKTYFKYFIERIDLRRDLHFYTNTSIDTLDYSGTEINRGSKVVFAAYGPKIRELKTSIPTAFTNENASLCLPGIIAIKKNKFINYPSAKAEMENFSEKYKQADLNGIAIIVIADDEKFTADSLNNFLWVTFTRCNPSHDIYGIDSFIENKHWGCNGPVIIDARIKPHHAPVLQKDPIVEQNIERFFQKGASLEGF